MNLEDEEKSNKEFSKFLYSNGDEIVETNNHLLYFDVDNPNYGNISFNTPKYGEVIKVCNNGDIFIKGRLVTNDMEVVDGIKEFFFMARAEK
jgi:hypothetical protein